jgi:hypothetical protein
MEFEVKTVVVIAGSAYGVGKTMKEANRNLLREDPKAKIKAYRFYDVPANELKFECGVNLTIWKPTHAICGRLATEE